MASSVMSSQPYPHMSESPGGMDTFAVAETWNLEDAGMPVDFFDTLMDFGSNN